VREAKRSGLAVTCDVAANHVHLADTDIGWFDAHCHLVPPLRSARDRDSLRAGLADGTIDVICSDHTPVDDDAKQLPFAESEPGATGLELLLPLTLKWAVEAKVGLPVALSRITADPARVLGIDAGHLAVGATADVCLFDPAARGPWIACFAAGAKNTPFLGWGTGGQSHTRSREGSWSTKLTGGSRSLGTRPAGRTRRWAASSRRPCGSIARKTRRSRRCPRYPRR
jgi:dihydroorotase